MPVLAADPVAVAADAERGGRGCHPARFAF
ncbi:hypothetical protein FP2506_04210 [Fulvimarina pelagi HTCC2506]|uniref:Uncharacterized protein n=1 Tax=Fulvimarina pelagi HTCC2506 TaxID=314231 RepID=Q0FZ76_9HYPH|nr:hypothetical protein FP2506_04210 [Fulvimarina pelagi HTCC2506]